MSAATMIQIVPTDVIQMAEQVSRMGPRPTMESIAEIPLEVRRVAMALKKVQCDAAHDARESAPSLAGWLGEVIEAWTIGHCETYYRVSVTEFASMLEAGLTPAQIFKFGCDRNRRVFLEKQRREREARGGRR